MSLNYLFAGYTVVWVILFVYVTGLWRKQQRMSQDLEALKKLTPEKQK